MPLTLPWGFHAPLHRLSLNSVLRSQSPVSPTPKCLLNGRLPISPGTPGNWFGRQVVPSRLSPRSMDHSDFALKGAVRY